MLHSTPKYFAGGLKVMLKEFLLLGTKSFQLTFMLIRVFKGKPHWLLSLLLHFSLLTSLLRFEAFDILQVFHFWKLLSVFPVIYYCFWLHYYIFRNFVLLRYGCVLYQTFIGPKKLQVFYCKKKYFRWHKNVDLIQD